MDLEGKKVIVRVDYNVPIKNGLVADDTRIKASIPTINYLLEKKCKIILMSHLGRPQKALRKGQSMDEVKKEFTLKPVVHELSELLGMEVIFAEHYLEEKLPDADIILLENIQFNEGEVTNGDGFAKKMASLADVYVNDGFAQSHREYATFCAITNHLPSCAGFLVEKEARELSKILNPNKPFVAMIAGAKADKIGALKVLIEKTDNLLIGGVMANTFLKTKGIDIGASRFDEETFDMAEELLSLGKDKFVLPVDLVVANEFSNDADTKTVSVDDIPGDYMALDIGPKSIEKYKSILKDAKTILWAGPLGVFEMEKFATSTKEIGKFLESLDAQKIAGGGDTGAAIATFGLQKSMTHVSTGGGASLEFIEKEGKLPALVALEKSAKNQ